MKVIDSSGWVDHVGEAPLAVAFWSHLAEVDAIVTPTVVLCEVCR